MAGYKIANLQGALRWFLVGSDCAGVLRRPRSCVVEGRTGVDRPCEPGFEILQGLPVLAAALACR